MKGKLRSNELRAGRSSAGKPENIKRVQYKSPPSIINEESSSEEGDDEREEILFPRAPSQNKIAKTVKESRTKEVSAELVTEEEHLGNMELPLKDVPELTYVPMPNGPLSRSAREPIPITGKGPAFHNKAAVEENQEVKTEEVMQKILSTPLTITVGDLLSMNKGIRDEMRKVLTRRRSPVESRAINLIATMSEPELYYWESYVQQNPLTDIVKAEELPAARVMKLESAQGNIPAGTFVIQDPVVQFLETLGPDDKPTVVYVARDSQSLRSVYPAINGVSEEECILDGGSQIVSMSKEIALKLGLAWDPDIQIHMQSANKQIEKTVGLARNVPFRFNDIVVYLQVHVINAPAYKVLLGRPFDVLTQSQYQNDSKGGMVITIKCPNTQTRATFTTHERGRAPDILKKNPEKDFQYSMN